MWTDASRQADLVRKTVQDPVACHLLYQARVNLELFNHARSQLGEAFNTLEFHNFARAFGSCHQLDGVFGDDIHLAEMVAAKQRVLGFLLSTVTAGHRFIRAIVQARSKDRNTDWREVKADLTAAMAEYHTARNFLEHVDEAIYQGKVSSDEEGSFSRERILTFTTSKGKFTFDFTHEALERLQTLHDNILEMLRRRDSTETA